MAGSLRHARIIDTYSRTLRRPLPPGRSVLAAPHLPSRAGAPLGAPRRDVQGREKTPLGPPCLRCYDPRGGGRKHRRGTARSRALWCRGAGRPAESLPERPGAARGRIPGTRSARAEAGALHPPKPTWDSQEKCWARHMSIAAHDDIYAGNKNSRAQAYTA